MTSRAERKRRKRTRISLAGGEVATARPPQGYRRDLQPAEDARETALQARLRHLGRKDSPDNRKAMSDPLWGCGVGIRLASSDMAPETRADLWQAVQHIRRTWAAYNRAIGAPPRHAQCLRILAPVDNQTSEDARTDTRTEAERDRQAVSAYMTLQGWLDYVDRPARSATIASVVDDIRVTNWPGILRALECVSEGIKGKRITVRIDTTP